MTQPGWVPVLARDKRGAPLYDGDRVRYTPVTRGATVDGTVELFVGDAFVYVWFDDQTVEIIATAMLVKIERAHG